MNSWPTKGKYDTIQSMQCDAVSCFDFAKGVAAMFLGFGKKTVYAGKDSHQFHEMREYLKRNNVKYQYKVDGQSGMWSGGGKLRGVQGSIGTGSGRDKLYEIVIKAKDAKRLGL